MHRFTHTFRSGETITLVVDMTQNPPAIAARPMDLSSKYPEEYRQWRHEVVVPALVRLSSEAQMRSFAARGLEALS